MAASRVEFSGFGSVGGYDRFGESQGLVEEGHWDWDYDSIFGIQADAELNNGWGLTAQGVARGYDFGSERRYQPQTELMFVSWQPYSRLKLRAGRMRTPLFLYSETLEVGYSYPWVRPPWSSVYTEAISAASHLDGLDATWYSRWGGWDLRVNGVIGTADASFFSLDYKFHRVSGISVSFEKNDLLGRYGLFANDTSIHNPATPVVSQYLAPFASSNPAFDSIVKSMEARHTTLVYYHAGLQQQFYPYTLDVEAIFLPSADEQYGFEHRGGYLSLSRELDSLTPYLALEASRQTVDDRLYRYLDATESTHPTGSNVIVDFVRESIRSGYNSISFSSRLLTLGCRYELAETVAIKFQAERSHIQYREIAASYRNGKSTYRKSYLSTTVDWVF